VGGLYQQQRQAFQELLMVFGIAAVLVFAILVIQFREFMPAILILAAAPLSLGGALLLLVLQLKGDWNVNPQDVVQANLSLLLDKSAAAKPLWALFTSIDVFSLWMVFLLAVGFGVASRKSTGAALWGVGIPWLLIVLVKVGWSALF
jgi:hypothetical protein